MWRKFSMRVPKCTCLVETPTRNLFVCACAERRARLLCNSTGPWSKSVRRDSRRRNWVRFWKTRFAGGLKMNRRGDVLEPDVFDVDAAIRTFSRSILGRVFSKSKRRQRRYGRILFFEQKSSSARVSWGFLLNRNGWFR